MNIGIDIQILPRTHHNIFRILELKEEVVFMHIKPYNEDIYDHIRCFTALL